MPFSGLRRNGRNKEETAKLSQVTIDILRADLTYFKEEMNQRVFAASAMTDQEDLMYLIEQVRADLATCKAEMNRRFEELRADLTYFKKEMNQRAFAGLAMTDQEDLQAQIDRLRAVVYSGNVGKYSHTDGILPHCYGCRRYFGTILWTLAIAGLIVGCGWNLREILQDMMESPTVTKMTFSLQGKLSLPPISVYQLSQYKSFTTQMLHAEKLVRALENGLLTEAYLEAIIKGVGIGLFYEQNITVPPSEITKAYKEAILQYGSLTEAGLALYKEYGIACDELFINCRQDMSPAMNCCDVFEFLWGFDGPQYALKWNTIFLDAFYEFLVNLRRLPKIEALKKGNFVEEPGNYQSYWVDIGNGVDQSGYDTHSIEVKPSEQVIIMLRQKRRNLKVSKDCVDRSPKLRYFRDYTISNCFIERCIIDKFTLCNISCEIPLLQLLNPDNLTGPPCEFDVYDSTCMDIIQNNHLQCRTNHRCLLPCNHTEVEYSVTKYPSTDPRKIELHFKYDTTEVQTFDETSRLTLWEYLGLISSILDLWLGITFFSVHRMLHRYLFKITYFKPNALGKNSAAAHSASPEQWHKMGNLSNTERDRRIRSSNRSYY